jgi:sulfofructose kinase
MLDSERRSPRILVIGNNTLDQVFTVEGRLPHDTKTQAVSLVHYPGGQAANVAFTLAGLGLAVDYLGSFGDDPAGTAVRGSLAAVGIGLAACPVIPDCPTHSAVLFIDRRCGDRTIVMYKDPRLAVPGEAVWLQEIAALDLLYLDNHEPAASLAAARLARERGIPVLADLEEVDENTPRILSLITSLIAPASVLHQLTGEDDLEAALARARRMGPHTVVATAGIQGCVGLHGALSPIFVPAAPCQVRDTTGAGDAFHAGFVAAAFGGRDFAECLSFATRLAAAKCEEPGPRLTVATLAAWRREVFWRDGRSPLL